MLGVSDRNPIVAFLTRWRVLFYVILLLVALGLAWLHGQSSHPVPPPSPPDPSYGG